MMCGIDVRDAWSHGTGDEVQKAEVKVPVMCCIDVWDETGKWCPGARHVQDPDEVLRGLWGLNSDKVP